MHQRFVISVVLSCSLLGGCGSEPPPPPVPPPAPIESPAAVVSAAPAPATPTAASEPTPQEKEKIETAKELEEDRAAWQDDYKAELARWDASLHAAAKALASRTYPSLRVALEAVLASPVRKPGNANRDAYRHPLETLEFFGIRPTMTVLEVSPGAGWYTELLAPVLAARGKLIDTNSDPNGPPDARGTFYGQRFQALLDKSPELFGKVQTVVVDGKAPNLDAAGKVDAVLLMREVHGMINGGTLDVWLHEIHKALKPGGVLGVVEHRASPDAEPVESSKKGYVPEKWLIEHVEAAGFKLTGQSEINANPKDTKDYPEGVWTLPPTLRLKDKDRNKYLAIGESDRMTLKFVRAPDPKDNRKNK